MKRHLVSGIRMFAYLLLFGVGASLLQGFYGFALFAVNPNVSFTIPELVVGVFFIILPFLILFFVKNDNDTGNDINALPEKHVAIRPLFIVLLCGVVLGLIFTFLMRS